MLKVQPRARQIWRAVLCPRVLLRENGNNVKEDRSSSTSIISLINRFMKGQRKLFFLAGIMLVFEAASAVIIPLLVAYVIDYMTVRLAQLGGAAVAPPSSPLTVLGLPTIFNSDLDTLLVVTIGIVVATMVNSLGDSLAEIYLAQGGQRLSYNMRVALHEHLQKLSLTFHTQKRTGDIVSRVTSDVAAIEDFVISSLSDIAGSVLLIGSILVTMLIKSWRVALVTAIIIPVMALLSNYFTQHIKAASKKRRASEGELASTAQEMLTSIKVIQTYGLGSYEQSLFAEQSRRAMDAALETAKLQARFSWAVNVLGALSTAAVIWMAVFLIFRAPVLGSIGLLTAYIRYIDLMFKPTKKLIQEWNTFGKLYASADRINAIFNIAPAVQDKPGAFVAPRFKGLVEFHDVSFTYQEASANPPEGVDGRLNLALKHVNFSVSPGEVLAIVGYTGAGKTTIVQLLPRLFDPTDGQVLFDGNDIRSYTLESLRAQISMVLQESILFSGSVVENIAYGKPDATGAEIIAAAKEANAHEFIDKMPQGYFTLLGERGSNLSGGQRQRLAIARAFIRDTPILILDEPSTGLDAESTSLVLKALKSLMQGKTTIIISHDLNLIKDADKILVVKDGEIIQSGTHYTLLASGGLYADLYTKQYGQPVETKAPSLIGEQAYLEGISAAPLVQDGKYEGKNLMSITDSSSMYYNLPENQSLHSRLPALATAFKATLMKERLQAELFPGADSEYTIESCKPGKAIYLPENICSMRFDLEIKNKLTGEIQTSLINARLFPTLSDCEDYLKNSLIPIAMRALDRTELKPYSTTTGMLSDMNLAFSVFPIDGVIPTLLEATDPQVMVDIFQRTLPDALSGNFDVDRFSLDMAHYGRQRRCVLRYQVIGKQPGDGVPQYQTVYGKVDADGTGALTIPVISALREEMSNGHTAGKFGVPRSLGFRPDLQLLMMEALPGKPLVAGLLKERIGAEEMQHASSINLEESIEACGVIAAALHSTGIKLGRKRTFEVEAQWLRGELQNIYGVLPDLGAKLLAYLDEAVAFESTSTSLPLCFSHGDFTYTQLIFDGEKTGLVDFDTVCQAEPALDLGQFLAYQRLAIRKDQNPAAPLSSEEVDHLGELFLESYIKTSGKRIVDEQQLRSRVSVYELVSLLRLAVHSWQKLKGNRLEHTIDLLEERTPWLIQAR